MIDINSHKSRGICRWTKITPRSVKIERLRKKKKRKREKEKENVSKRLGTGVQFVYAGLKDEISSRESLLAETSPIGMTFRSPRTTIRRAMWPSRVLQVFSRNRKFFCVTNSCTLHARACTRSLIAR